MALGDTATFKKMNFFVEWIFGILNILNISALIYPRQKWLLPNVSNSSEIIQGSLGDISSDLYRPQSQDEIVEFYFFVALSYKQD